MAGAYKQILKNTLVGAACWNTLTLPTREVDPPAQEDKDGRRGTLCDVYDGLE